MFARIARSLVVPAMLMAALVPAARAENEFRGDDAPLRCIASKEVRGLLNRVVARTGVELLAMTRTVFETHRMGTSFSSHSVYRFYLGRQNEGASTYVDVSIQATSGCFGGTEKVDSVTGPKSAPEGRREGEPVKLDAGLRALVTNRDVLARLDEMQKNEASLWLNVTPATRAGNSIYTISSAYGHLDVTVKVAGSRTEVLKVGKVEIPEARPAAI
jgi:hypothetical protein